MINEQTNNVVDAVVRVIKSCRDKTIVENWLYAV